jgi:hypothetical protein
LRHNVCTATAVCGRSTTDAFAKTKEFIDDLDEHAPAKKAPAKKAPAKKMPAKKAHGKKVSGAATAGKKAQAESASGQRKSESNTAKGAGETRKALPAAPADPLIILGLTEQYTLPDLRRSWRAYAGRHHPDKGGDTATFTRGLAAYETLARRFS